MSTYQKLSCDLSDSEVQNYSNELARITSEQAEIEAEKKEVLSDFTAKLNKCIADSRVLARKVTTRKEERQVECDYEYDYAKGLVFTIRTDTGVTINQRKLTDDERQEKLDFEKKEDKAAELEDEAVEKQYLEDCEGMTAAGEQETPEEDHSISVCGNTECHYNDATEGNGCKQYEMVWECKQAVQEGAEDTEAAKAEMARRDSICKTWNECEHQDICFTPQNEEDSICFKDEPHRLPVVTAPASTTDEIPSFTFQGLMGWEYSANEAKILAVGFRLIKSDRDSKTIYVTAADPRAGWLTVGPYDTFVAAERDLEEYIKNRFIQVAGNKKGGVCDNKCTHKLRDHGFEFYRREELRIKIGPSWKNWKKFDTPNECRHAWEELLTNPKALED
jgi:hypothetical protein